jgi:hypothetical protein
VYAMTHRLKHSQRAAIVLAALPTLILSGISPASGGASATGNEVEVNSRTSERGFYAYDNQTDRRVTVLPGGSSRNPDGQEGGVNGIFDTDLVTIVSTTCARRRTATGLPGAVIAGPRAIDVGDISYRGQVRSKTADGRCPTKWEGTTF